MENQQTLQIKFYKNFKSDEDFILVIGSKAAYRKAAIHFKQLNDSPLTSISFIDINDLGDIDPDKLVFTQEECASFAGICENLATEEKAGHEYLSIKNLPDTDFLISCGEYKTFP